MVNMKKMAKKITSLRKEAKYFYIRPSDGLFGSFWHFKFNRNDMRKVLGLTHANALVRYHKQNEMHYNHINETSEEWGKFVVIAEEHIDNEIRKHPKFFN